MSLLILQGDARRLKDKSVDGIVTSPPYNAKKRYPNDSWDRWEDYIAFLRECYAECVRVARGPVCWVLPLMIQKHFIYASVGDWEMAVPIIAASENLVTCNGQFGRGWTRAYLSCEMMVMTMKPKPGVWIIFAPQPWIGAEDRNRPRGHPAPFVKEIPYGAMRMFPECRIWLDPFAGTGTTPLVARSLGLRSIGMDCDWSSIEIMQQEVAQQILLADPVVIAGIQMTSPDPHSSLVQLISAQGGAFRELTEEGGGSDQEKEGRQKEILMPQRHGVKPKRRKGG